MITHACSFNVKVDVYSFGMCVLELIAREEPYSECNGSISELIHNVRARIYPDILRRISSKLAREFISQCLLPADERPSAAELLQHEFLDIVAADDEEVNLGKEIVVLNSSSFVKLPSSFFLFLLDPISEINKSDPLAISVDSSIGMLNRTRSPSTSESISTTTVAAAGQGLSIPKQGQQGVAAVPITSSGSLSDMSHISLTASSLLQHNHNAGKMDSSTTNTSVNNDYNCKLMDSPGSIGHGTSYSANSTDGSVPHNSFKSMEETRRAKFDAELGCIDQRENTQLVQCVHLFFFIY